MSEPAPVIALAQLALALGGEVSGRGVIAPGPGHTITDRSLSVRPHGDRLLIFSFAGDDFAECLAHVRDRLGGHVRFDTPAAPTKGTREHARRQREKAAWLWAQRRPIEPIEGTIASRYLRKARGYTGPLPATLAFLPPRTPDQHPAMISAFGLADELAPGVLQAPKDVTAVHLTLLRPDGSGKAEVDAPKLGVGSPRGKPIVLAPPTDLLGLAVCEGIETGLSIHAATGLGVWAAGSAGLLPALADAVPSYIEIITIYSEADRAGRQGADKLAQGLAKRGCEVLIAEALDG